MFSRCESDGAGWRLSEEVGRVLALRHFGPRELEPREAGKVLFEVGHHILFAPNMGESLGRHAVRTMPQIPDKRDLFRWEQRNSDSVAD
jgi:hypothetical protein